MWDIISLQLTIKCIGTVKVEHTDSKCDFLKKKKSKIYRLILCYVFFKVTHVLPLISAQNCDKMHYKTDAAGLFLIKSDL